MSRSLEDDDMIDVAKIVVKNPKVDAEKVSEARKLVQILRAHGVSRRGYNLLPPFRRQMHPESGCGKEQSQAAGHRQSRAK